MEDEVEEVIIIQKVEPVVEEVEMNQEEAKEEIAIAENIVMESPEKEEEVEDNIMKAAYLDELNKANL